MAFGLLILVLLFRPTGILGRPEVEKYEPVLKRALFSALLVILVSYPILGLKLRTVGIKLEVLGADAQTLWTIAAAALAMFVWQLFRDRIPPAGSRRRLQGQRQRPEELLSLPSTQRWAVLALVVVAFVWPFFASRAVDIATLILIYVMLGIGLNIVVGPAGLLDLGYVGFYAVGAYTYALLLAEYAGSASGPPCRSPG